MFSKTLSSPDSKSMSKTSTNPAKCICNLYGGRREGGVLMIMLKTAHLQCKKPYFSGIFKPKNPLTHVFNIYIIFPVSIFSRTC